MAMKRIDAMRGNVAGVCGWVEPVSIPTYPVMEADRNPMFLEKRVYQGSSGRVYPLPFIDRVSHDPVEQTYNALHLENEHVYLMILPELGGRIHIGYDKAAQYDFFYRQEVIKPALVGLAGPWISGGVEFNWPQHHRPSTYMPCEWSIEKGDDGSVTIWLSEHEPMNRMKGMHGVCLRPNSNLIELKVRLYNRTPYVQTFLWWANVAARVHEQYQSFFPPDVHFVADHAKRATATFPHVKGDYYGVHYGERAEAGVPEDELPTDFLTDGSYAPDRLDWYANIPVPTSYMVVKTGFDFFGGYDHKAQAGFVHVADRHISPGKKQWTWGNHEFGYAWDRNLTDTGGPYVELMAGVYTDNQPDFSFLAPYETKTFSQFWYPIREILPPQAANREAAISVRQLSHGLEISLIATNDIESGLLKIEGQNGEGLEEPISLRVGEPTKVGVQGFWEGATISLYEQDREVLRTSWPIGCGEPTEPPEPAREPSLPSEVTSNDELFLIGLHLEQYRHATRSPETYWLEAIRRDPGDYRCHLAMGRTYLKRGMFKESESHLRSAVSRLIERNPNPRDGEALYDLGVNLQLQGRLEEAYEAFAKSVWNYATKGAACLAMARLSNRLGWHDRIGRHLDDASVCLGDSNTLVCMKAAHLRNAKRQHDSLMLVKSVLSRDPLDHGALFEVYQQEPEQKPTFVTAMRSDPQNYLDLAWDYYWSGYIGDAIAILGEAPPHALVYYTLCYFGLQDEDKRASIDWTFANRLEDMIVLENALETDPSDPDAAYLLGCFNYDRRRYEEAIQCWESTTNSRVDHAGAWRNLGLAYFNVLGNRSLAKEAYDHAFQSDPDDARILYERDQLWKRLGVPPEIRLGELELHLSVALLRDDLALELCSLYNALNQPQQSQRILKSRQFAPWEGGEGVALGQHSRTYHLLSRQAALAGHLEEAVVLLEHALEAPSNLGEARHLLANASDLWVALGDAYFQLGDREGAECQWNRAAHFRGDFQDMMVKSFSEMTYYRALALRRLGREDECVALLHGLKEYSMNLFASQARIDYFATSLPTMLLFADDIQRRQELTARFLEAQARFGLGDVDDAKALLETVLKEDPNSALAQDLYREVFSVG